MTIALPETVRAVHQDPGDAFPKMTMAFLSRNCCDFTRSGDCSMDTARWVLSVKPLAKGRWPEYRWPVARRNLPPTVAERNATLSALGWRAMPDATWKWDELSGSTSHGHPEVIDLFATLLVVPMALEEVLAELRDRQPGDQLAEQRHQFLDLDPDLVRDDYTRPAVIARPGVR